MKHSRKGSNGLAFQNTFNEAMQDYCKYRWFAFKFLKRRIKKPLANYELLDLEDD